MKVLEKGGWDNPWSMEMVCSEKECSSKLLVEEGDVKPVYNYSGYYALCPVCGKNISIQGKDLPIRPKRN
jgi:hypothetical protein